mmetsp:Transcript_30397/g.76437  ORF Transcript_30397/g.76437 Transcript_30397/m.76437 type:complete len:273 (+) Transcript_30397:238-1056(+)
MMPRCASWLALRLANTMSLSPRKICASSVTSSSCPAAKCSSSSVAIVTARVWKAFSRSRIFVQKPFCAASTKALTRSPYLRSKSEMIWSSASICRSPSSSRSSLSSVLRSCSSRSFLTVSSSLKSSSCLISFFFLRSNLPTSAIESPSLFCRLLRSASTKRLFSAYFDLLSLRVLSIKSLDMPLNSCWISSMISSQKDRWCSLPCSGSSSSITLSSVSTPDRLASESVSTHCWCSSAFFSSSACFFSSSRISNKSSWYCSRACCTLSGSTRR